MDKINQLNGESIRLTPVIAGSYRNCISPSTYMAKNKKSDVQCCVKAESTFSQVVSGGLKDELENLLRKLTINTKAMLRSSEVRKMLGISPGTLQNPWISGFSVSTHPVAFQIQ